MFFQFGRFVILSSRVAVFLGVPFALLEVPDFPSISVNFRVEHFNSYLAHDIHVEFTASYERVAFDPVPPEVLAELRHQRPFLSPASADLLDLALPPRTGPSTFEQVCHRS